jgi:hypothetical protein
MSGIIIYGGISLYGTARCGAISARCTSGWTRSILYENIITQLKK